jgi:hypothetical protein
MSVEDRLRASVILEKLKKKAQLRALVEDLDATLKRIILSTDRKALEHLDNLYHRVNRCSDPECVVCPGIEESYEYLQKILTGEEDA